MLPYTPSHFRLRDARRDDTNFSRQPPAIDEAKFAESCRRRTLSKCLQQILHQGSLLLSKRNFLSRVGINVDVREFANC
jgi:hypothetical protein